MSVPYPVSRIDPVVALVAAVLCVASVFTEGTAGTVLVLLGAAAAVVVVVRAVALGIRRRRPPGPAPRDPSHRAKRSRQFPFRRPKG